MVGQLVVFTGPMFAGKTEHLIKEVLWRSYFSEDVGEIAIFKPSCDRRYDATRIVSHAGAAVVARPIASRPQELDGRHRAVFLDEVQFFSEPFFEGDIVAIIRELRLAGSDVWCAGLDMDYAGRAFEVTAALMAESSQIHRLAARCETCGAPASVTSKRSGRGTRPAGRFNIGAQETYAPACLEHWHQQLGAG